MVLYIQGTPDVGLYIPSSPNLLCFDFLAVNIVYVCMVTEVVMTNHMRLWNDWHGYHQL